VLPNGNLVVATWNQPTPNQLLHPALSTFAPTGLPVESHLYAGDSTDFLGQFIRSNGDLLIAGKTLPSTGIDDISRTSDGSIFVALSVGEVTNLGETNHLGLARLSVSSPQVEICRSILEISDLRATRRALAVHDGSTTTASVTTAAVPTTASDTILPLRITAVCGHPQQP
jgi:hypothetical protein